jgi:hypothetical protein
MAAVTVAVGGLVLALTQSTKRWTPEGWGPLIAAVWTTLAMFVWAFSQVIWPPERTALFDLLAVWVAVYTSALGLYSAAMVPSGSRQQIGTGNGSVAQGNVPVGETKPPTDPPPAPRRRPRASPPRAAVLTEPVVSTPVPRRRPRPTIIDDEGEL